MTEFGDGVQKGKEGSLFNVAAAVTARNRKQKRPGKARRDKCKNCAICNCGKYKEES